MTAPLPRVVTLAETTLDEPLHLDHPNDVTPLLINLIGDADREMFVVVSLDYEHNVIAADVTNIGDTHGVTTGPQQVFKTAFLRDARGIIVAHNHPRASLEPSTDDIDTASKIAQTGMLFGVPLADAYVVNANGFTSISDYATANTPAAATMPPPDEVKQLIRTLFGGHDHDHEDGDTPAGVMILGDPMHV